jgi:uncharacterized membrane protein YphA (DoxX/SURF4 family)
MSSTEPGLRLLLARILVAFIFVMSAIHKIQNFGITTDQIAGTIIPLPALAAGGAILFEIAGGLALILGFKTRISAWLLILFMIPATLTFHQYWAAEEFRRQFIHFMKNLAIIGGLLVFTTTGPGPWALDSE